MTSMTIGSPAPFGGRLRHFFVDPAGAEVAIEFSSVAIVGARIESKRGTVEIRSLVSEPLASGSFAPTLEAAGFEGREEIRSAVKRVVTKLGVAPSLRTALVVPDVVARFRLFAQSEVAAEPKKRNAVIGFRMQKLLPFASADARVVSAWPRSAADPVLGIGFSASVLAAYEQVGEAFGLDVGSIETSSMALLSSLSRDGDALLVRHDPTWLTLTLTRNGWPVCIRSFDSAVASRPEEVRHEIASTAVFWRDRLAGAQLVEAQAHAQDEWFEVLSRDVAAVFGCTPKRAMPPPGLVAPGTPASVARSATPALALLAASH